MQLYTAAKNVPWSYVLIVKLKKMLLGETSPVLNYILTQKSNDVFLEMPLSIPVSLYQSNYLIIYHLIKNNNSGNRSFSIYY